MYAFLFTIVATLPSPQLVDVDGPELLTEVRRSAEPIVVINVWATWCGPCVRELPIFFDAEKHYEGRVRFMFVSADFTSQRSEAAKLLTEKGASHPSFFRRGKDQPFIEALHPKWNGTIPATFVFDRSGRRLRFWQGSLSEQELIRALDALLD